MIELVHTMKDIDKKEWNTLAGADKVETTHEWFSFVEDISFEPKPYYCHAVYKEKGETVGILPAYYHFIFIKDFVWETGFFTLGSLLPKMKTPLKVTKVSIPLSCDSRYFGDKKYFHDCLTELKTFSRKRRDFLFAIMDSNEKIDSSDLFCIETFPEAYTEPYPSWDAYIQSQRGKRGKHMRYEYKKSIESGTKTYIQENLDGLYTVLYDLYLNVSVRNKSPFTFPRDFFKKMDAHLRGYAKCILAENKGKITGHLLFLENDHIISCKYAGRDYEAQDIYVYFRLMYELIKYAIDKKKPLSMERTSYDAKFRRGFNPIEKRNYLKSYCVIGNLYLDLLKDRNSLGSLG